MLSNHNTYDSRAHYEIIKMHESGAPTYQTCAKYDLSYDGLMQLIAYTKRLARQNFTLVVTEWEWAKDKAHQRPGNHNLSVSNTTGV